MSDIDALSGLRVLVVGLGREGTALATYLVEQGLQVTATDLQPAEKLEQDVTALAAVGVSLVLGEHPLSLLDETDLLFVSPGIPLDAPFLQEARSRKLPLSTESRLFCYVCPVPIVAITGTSGKTTTTTLVGNILEADAEIGQATDKNVWVGGNIGRPLIAVVDQIKAGDAVVMELSSFQLEYFHAHLNRDVEVDKLPCARPDEAAALFDNWSPPISAILNVTPNHLDRHPSIKQYIQAKRAAINYQDPTGVIIMNLDNDMTRTIGRQFGAKTRWFSLEAQMVGGACLANDEIVLIDQDGARHTVAARSEVKLLGRHNLSNILAACLLTREAGAGVEAMRQVITTFTGVTHRLEFVREFDQARYYNDSISTSPDRLIAALHSFVAPIVLLAGGRDKHLPWDEAARLMIHKTDHVILFGEAADMIAMVIDKVRPEITITQTTVHRCADLEEAVTLAAQLAQPGNVVLLSPGCASFDAFPDFTERGARFKELVLQL
jgi:UDP-N-acetylmuramoylalanine--D-glutamate ligase